MILATTLALTLQAAPTLAQIDDLSPQAVGEVVLAGKDHGPIARIVVPERRGMNPPGMVERQLVEQTVVGPDGCSRRRWTATFFHGPGGEGQAKLDTTWAKTEIALPGPAGCPDDGYTMVQDIEPAQAFAALRRLDDLRFRGAKARFTCSDETDSHLCADPEAMRPALAKLSPWAVLREGGQTVFWMGTPGGVVTQVRYDPAQPERVTVQRAVPAPF